MSRGTAGTGGDPPLSSKSYWKRSVVSSVESNLAKRWFKVQAEYQALNRVQMIWLVLRELVITFLTLGIFLGSFDPKRFCDVVVLRRDTNDPVILFRYKHLEEANAHLMSLQYRLSHLQVYDFCRELGIPIDSVQGTGFDDDPDPEAAWIGISHSHRRT